MPEEDFKLQKSKKIWQCVTDFSQAKSVAAKSRIVEELRSLAICELGLINDSTRKACWPILLNVQAIYDAEQSKLSEDERDTATLLHSKQWKSKHYQSTMLTHPKRVFMV